MPLQYWTKTADGIVFFALAHKEPDANYDYVIIFTTDSDAYSAINPYMGTPSTITVNNDTWYYGMSNNLAWHDSYMLNPIGCRLPDYASETDLWNNIANDLLAHIYTDDFVENYQTGVTYNVVFGDMEKTVRKALAIWLYKNISLKTYNAYKTLLTNLETMITRKLDNYKEMI